MVVAVSAAGMMRNAQAAGQQGPPPVTITIDSDAEIYQEGSVASFTVTMTRRVGNQDRPVPMMRRYLAATFPDADTEVELVQLDATHWIFTPLLEGEGDQTLAVALHEDNARQVAAIEIIIGRLQDRNTVYQEILDADPPPLLRRLLEHLIALNTWLIERFEERVEELEEPLATASWVIAVDGTPPAITNVQPYAGQLLAEARPGITADLSDNISGVDPASAVVSVDYVVIPSVATEESLAAMPEEDLDDGQHILWITVADAVGNVGERFSVFTTDVTAPVIAGLSPADAAMVTTDKPTISATYSDATA